MSFVDETVSTAKNLFDAASKKTADTVQIQKLRLAVARKKSELSREYEMLGRFYYGTKTGKVDEEQLALQEQTVEQVIGELEQRIKAFEAAKNITTCPACGQKNPNGAGFCNHCGTKLAEEPAFVPEEEAAEEDL